MLHWKVAPYKNQLNANYLKVFNVVDSVLKLIIPVLSRIPNITLGNRIQLDVSYVIIIGVLKYSKAFEIPVILIEIFETSFSGQSAGMA